ncbi:hypothetical protein ABW19_dt0205475 [Dactylella cylindrospora]|nr:hypothetical protein ABW19_dt0205475 [Dactylella cylindrospora]
MRENCDLSTEANDSGERDARRMDCPSGFFFQKSRGEAVEWIRKAFVKPVSSKSGRSFNANLWVTLAGRDTTLLTWNKYSRSLLLLTGLDCTGSQIQNGARSRPSAPQRLGIMINS